MASASQPGKASHSTKQPQQGSEHAAAAWVAPRLQPSLGSELSGRVSYIQSQQPRVFTYIFPIISIFFSFSEAKDHRSAIWTHTNEKEWLPCQQTTSTADGAVDLSKPNLISLRDITLVDFVGMDAWMDAWMDGWME